MAKLYFGFSILLSFNEIVYFLTMKPFGLQFELPPMKSGETNEKTRQPRMGLNSKQ
jgi:hypothetical protein